MQTKKSLFIHHLARWGTVSIGIVYIFIGVIAMLSLLGLQDGGADEDSVLELLSETYAGIVLIWAILVGMGCYMAWRIFESITDPYGYGTTVKGLSQRTGIALSAVAYGILAFSAIQALLGIGLAGDGDEEQQLLVAEIFQWRSGEWIVGLCGILVGLTGILEFRYVIKREHEPRLDIGHLSRVKQKAIHVLAWAGHFARGIILSIVGYSLIHAAIDSNPQDVLNTDKAFNFIGESLLGHPLFVMVAVGTVCYGLFMLASGIYYDFDED